MECTAANGDRVRIYLDIIDGPAEGPVTRICVRVATFGDYALSERILNQVGAHLVVVVPPSGPAPSAGVSRAACRATFANHEGR